MVRRLRGIDHDYYQLDYDIDYHQHINQHDLDYDQHIDQHDHDPGTNYNHHDLDQHILDHDDNHNRATLHRLMHMAMVRRSIKMDQSLWR
jgi:hypothetical protein